MRRAIPFLAIILLSSVASGWEPLKVDEDPVFSDDGRSLAFERLHGGGEISEVVVWDLTTGEAIPVVGELDKLTYRDRHSFAATGSVYACIVKRSGSVVSTVWNKGAGLPDIPNLEEQFGRPQWIHGHLRFQTRDVEWNHNRIWDFEPLSGRVTLLSTKRNSSRHDLDYPPTPPPLGAPERLAVAVSPSISPDSRTLAVAAIGHGYEMPTWAMLGERVNWQNVYLLNRDGSGLRRLTSGGGTHPVWHPNGKGLAYITPKGDLAWINRDGSGFTRLVKGIKVSKGLIWDPDGRSFRVLQQTEDGIAWYRIVPPSSTLRLVGKPIVVPPGGEAFLAPSGKRAVWFERGERTTSMLLIAGKDRRELQFAPDTGGSWEPAAAWSHDEKKLAFTVMGSLRVMDLPSGKIKQLTGTLY